MLGKQFLSYFFVLTEIISKWIKLFCCFECYFQRFQPTHSPISILILDGELLEWDADEEKEKK